MVSRLRTLLALLLMLPVVPALGANLTVEPSRTELHEGETLTLVIKSTMKLSFSLDNIFDLGMPDLPMPDIDKLEPDFKVLSQNQSYSIQTINGDMHGDVTWTFEIAPTRTGTLQIPALSFKGATSEPIDISVRSGTAPHSTAEPKPAFIELSADKDQLYVQEQLVITVRLFFTGNLIRGELSEPKHPTALIETLGTQREYKRFRDNQQYRVVERRYAIFPQQPGSLSLPPLQFEGQSRDAVGRLKYLRDSAELFEIPVKTPPTGFTGDVWLPASSLTLTETGLAGELTIEPGQNLSRTLLLKAQGLTAEALPPLPTASPDGIRSYPEPAERTTDTGASSLIGSLTQTTALVGVTPGVVELPEIRIPWWDTTSDSEKVAVLPARTVTITGAGGAVVEPATPALPSATASAPSATPAEASPSLWRWISLVLALGWTGTALAWWLQNRVPNRPAQREDTKAPQEQALFQILCAAARQGLNNTPELLLNWYNRFHREGDFRTLSQLLAYLQDEQLAAQLGRLQRHSFGRRPNDGEAWDGEPLVASLNRLRKTVPRTPTDSDLAPLYPASLTSRV
ncbi:BatD family protein [Marinobacter sp. SS21]|uniref:BatD family protein n=1 Tax=Marinobacter sp. SS21 TaxID=2979460 RepID=UPI00232A8850|nr:BatD family protein [Marinobacter sp. SS21]MDC0662126.1 BatD family protein [Marinobacter sp. SS21]